MIELFHLMAVFTNINQTDPVVQLQNNSHQTKLVVPVVTVFVSPAVAVVVAVMMAVAATLMLLRLRGGAAVVVGGGRHDHVDRAERRITSIL